MSNAELALAVEGSRSNKVLKDKISIDTAISYKLNEMVVGLSKCDLILIMHIYGGLTDFFKDYKREVHNARSGGFLDFDNPHYFLKRKFR